MRIPFDFSISGHPSAIILEDSIIRHWCRIAKEEGIDFPASGSTPLPVGSAEQNEDFLCILEQSARMPTTTEQELLWRAIGDCDEQEIREITDSIVEEKYGKTSWFLSQPHRSRIENSLFQTFCQIRENFDREDSDSDSDEGGKEANPFDLDPLT
jgi:hypothetical protein